MKNKISRRLLNFMIQVNLMYIKQGKLRFEESEEHCVLRMNGKIFVQFLPPRW